MRNVSRILQEYDTRHTRNGVIVNGQFTKSVHVPDMEVSPALVGRSLQPKCGPLANGTGLLQRKREKSTSTASVLARATKEFLLPGGCTVPVVQRNFFEPVVSVACITVSAAYTGKSRSLSHACGGCERLASFLSLRPSGLAYRRAITDFLRSSFASRAEKSREFGHHSSK